jgi:serine/threonine protein kinase
MKHVLFSSCNLQISFLVFTFLFNFRACCFFRYYHTCRLTESSDVYSFGVVLLVTATGKPPLVSGHGHIVQRVNQMITKGYDINSIADVRLEGAYDVNSMWKVIDTANKCTSDCSEANDGGRSGAAKGELGVGRSS